MSKFKVGDYIRCIKYKDTYINEGLKKAKIIKLDKCFTIKILEHDESIYNGMKMYCIFSGLNFDDYFELVEYNVKSLYPNLIVDYYDAFNTQTNVYEKYIKGIWENKEEIEMNKVLELWYTRNKENIYKKYKDLENLYVEEHYEIVKEYNKLIENFENDLEDFYTKYNDITINDDMVICTHGDHNIYKYVIDKSVIRTDATIVYKEDKNKEYKELTLKYEDINALLSMSDDLEYQQSILIEYGIIDKKTKRVINEDNSK